MEPDEKTTFLNHLLPVPLVGSSPSHLIPWTEESFQAETTYMQMLSSPLQGEPPTFHFFVVTPLKSKHMYKNYLAFIFILVYEKVI